MSVSRVMYLKPVFFLMRQTDNLSSPYNKHIQYQIRFDSSSVAKAALLFFVPVFCRKAVRADFVSMIYNGRQRAQGRLTVSLLQCMDHRCPYMSGGFCMSETRYIISDAAKMIDVEPHVLRYWEEELGMDIPRNEMGHRYYTDREVKIFSAVRDLKNKGFQLKAIKMVLSAISDEMPADNIIPLSSVRKNDAPHIHKAEKGNSEDDKITVGVWNEDKITDENSAAPDAGVSANAAAPSKSCVPAKGISSGGELLTAEEKMQHFKYMMDGIMLQALRKNNEAFAESLIEKISDRVIGEMDDLFRIQEEREEERFRNLDEMMRSRQRGRKEAAAAGIGRKENRRGLFKKNRI